MEGDVLVENPTFFKACRQYCIRFMYKSKSYVRYCTMPIDSKLKDVEEYLCSIFLKENFEISKYSHEQAYILNEQETILEKDDGWNIGLYWKDGIQWELELNIDGKHSEIMIVTEVDTTEKEIFEKMKEVNPLVQHISTIYQTECWIKNNISREKAGGTLSI